MKRSSKFVVNFRDVFTRSKLAETSREVASPSGEVPSDSLEARLQQMESDLELAKKSLVQLVTAVHRATSFDFGSGPLDEEKVMSIRFRLEFLGDASQRVISENGFDRPELIGRSFNVSMPVDAVNLEDFNAVEELFISSVVEPLILSGDTVVQRGRVLVNRQSPSAEESA